MFGLFGKKVNKAVEAVKKFENKDLAEAAIGAAMLIAGADGEFEPAEVKVLKEIAAKLNFPVSRLADYGVPV